MKPQIDESLHWTEHYVKHGFAVVKKTVELEWIRRAMDEVTRLLDTSLPPCLWSAETIPVLQQHTLHLHSDAHHMSVLSGIYDQPGVRDVIDTLFGSPSRWNNERLFQLFVTTFDPAIKPSPGPHLDFVNCPIPILGSGFLFQLSLLDSESDGGNILIYPGTHKRVMRALIENPEQRYPRDLKSLLQVEPYEFVAEAGDMLIVHHLVGHSSSHNYAVHRTPRIVLHGQIMRDEWLTEVDAEKSDLSPWERSLAVAGPYRDQRNEKQIMLDFFSQKQSPSVSRLQ